MTTFTNFLLHEEIDTTGWSEDERILGDRSERDKLLIDHMRKTGNKYLDAGSFKAAFINPQTHLVKLVLLDENNGYERYNFQKWIKFCNARPNNPHLPKIYLDKPLVIGGQKYTVANMEKLFSISESEIAEIKYPLWELVYICKEQFLLRNSPRNKTVNNKKIEKAKNLFMNHDPESTASKNMGLLALSIEDFDLFLNTMAEIIRLRPKNAFIDLHIGNIMLTSDGLIVFSDPWAS